MVLAGQAIVLLAIAVPRLLEVRVTPADYPIAATAWLARSGVAAHLAVDFDWGEYVIWHVGPRVQVSVDGRRETVYSDAVHALNQRFIAGADGWDRLLTERPSDLVLVGLAMAIDGRSGVGAWAVFAAAAAAASVAPDPWPSLIATGLVGSLLLRIALRPPAGRSPRWDRRMPASIRAALPARRRAGSRG